MVKALQMNILLIGNGFDLEHNLPTSYKDFLEFCERARIIYAFHENASVDEFIQTNLRDWKMDDSIKKKLSVAFEKRKCNKIYKEDDCFDLKIITQNEALDEMYTHIKENVWLEYFLNCASYLGENWIDFETEISRVIQALDSARFQIESGGSVTGTEEREQKILVSLQKVAKGSLRDMYGNIAAIDNCVDYLNKELERLIRALEIYIAEFVGKIIVTKKSTDIEMLNPDHILSFNYSDTYERVYGEGEQIKYDYIHGKADITKNVLTSNLVLGIDEYLDDDVKDKELEFLTFKKFYQRIYKSTGNAYLAWVDEIKDGYADYLRKERYSYATVAESFKDGNFDINPFQKSVCADLAASECPQHTLYIFGHSLDVTDKDILKLFICNDNVQTKIFYYRKNKNDKKVLGKLIKNLILIMGQDELVRRTGGAHKTIEFIPQTVLE